MQNSLKKKMKNAVMKRIVNIMQKVEWITIASFPVALST